MGRAPCCDKASVKKGPWSPEEDAKLTDFIKNYGTGGNWIAFPQKAGLNRCGKSCRLRWLNYLRPDIKHGDFSQEEDATICTLFANIGSRWSIIASQLPGRTDNDIKNYWNTKLKKKFFGIVSLQKKQQHHHHHQALLHQQQQQQQRYFSSSSFSSSSQANNIVTPKLELLCAAAAAGFGSDTLTFASSGAAAATSTPLLRAPYYHHPPQMEMSSMINFGSDPSCSSSGGSCTPISYGPEQLEYDRCEQINGAAGNDNYIYDVVGIEDDSRPIFLGGGIHVESSLDYTFEEIKHLLSSNSGCNFGNSS